MYWRKIIKTVTKSSTFVLPCLENLWLVQTEDGANGMDFRVGFMNGCSSKARLLHVTKAKWSI